MAELQNILQEARVKDNIPDRKLRMVVAAEESVNFIGTVIYDIIRED